jgi:hypothetical protein
MSWIEDWLSSPRIFYYSSVTDGDVDKALEMYEKEIELSFYFLRDISHFEILLRNSYDKVLKEKYNSNWLLDENSPVSKKLFSNSGKDANLYNRQKIEEAKIKSRKSSNHDKILAELTLGFWSRLTDNIHEHSLWSKYLHYAYPKGTNRKEIHKSLEHIRIIRNRIAHNEPIRNYNILEESHNLFALAKSLNFDAGTYIEDTSKIC